MKVASKPASVALIMLAALPLGGCPPPNPYTYLIYNNSQANMVVHYTRGQETWDWHEVLNLQQDELERMPHINRDVVLDGKHIEFTDVFLDVQLGSHRLRYRLTQSVPENLSVYKFGGVVSAYQIEPDLNLYIVSPQAILPMVPPSPQPAGYPVEPDTSFN